jgi:hypothetical protein
MLRLRRHLHTKSRLCMHSPVAVKAAGRMLLSSSGFTVLRVVHNFSGNAS